MIIAVWLILMPRGCRSGCGLKCGVYRAKNNATTFLTSAVMDLPLFLSPSTLVSGPTVNFALFSLTFYIMLRAENMENICKKLTDLPNEVLRMILLRLHFTEILRCKQVTCTDICISQSPLFTTGIEAM